MKIKKKSVLFYSSLISLAVGSLFYFTSPSTTKPTQVAVLLISSANKWPEEQLKNGLERAAKELNVELLYQEVTSSEFKQQQKGIIKQLLKTPRIITYGFPEASQKLKTAKVLLDLGQNRLKENQRNEKRTTDYSRGTFLGKILAKETTKTDHVVYWRGKTTTNQTARQAGLEMQLARTKNLQTFTGDRAGLMQLLKKETAPVTLVMDNPQQMVMYSETLVQDSSKVVKQVYLLEFSDQVLAAIDHNEITGAVLQDDYSRGYQSLYQLLGNKKTCNRQLPKDQLVTKQNLFSAELEPLIFPYQE